MRKSDGLHKLALTALLITSTLVLVVVTAWGVRLLALRNQAAAQPQPTVSGIAGFPMSGDPAPDFTLVDQFG
ncbi:MAG TPA: hypothetical protein VGT44_07255, partial [Ktedonobacteraceae bacterium]|nr:hypothetical protein [Ktedonobacteraceae bacterium]